MTNPTNSLTSRKKLLTKHKVRAKGKDLWNKISVTDKKNVISSVVPKKFSELRITSGSTGDPLYVFYSEEAVNAFINRTRVSLKKSGVTKKDIALNLFAYGNYVPGSMYEKACQLEKIAVLPLGAPNTYSKEKVVECMHKIRPSVWLSVPSYALGLLGVLRDLNSDYKPKKVIVAGEKLLESYIESFKKFGVEVSNHFGLTECPAIGVSKKNNLLSIEVINDGIYAEAIKNEDGLHFVITDLNNYSTPIIRYDTKDIIKDIKLNKDGSLKEFLLVGRNDDLIKLQGTLTSKAKLIEILNKFTDKFIINIKTKEDKDWLEITIDNHFKERERDIQQSLAFISCKKEIIFNENVEVPKTISNKIKHIVDLRK